MTTLRHIVQQTDNLKNSGFATVVGSDENVYVAELIQLHVFHFIVFRNYFLYDTHNYLSE